MRKRAIILSVVLRIVVYSCFLAVIFLLYCHIKYGPYEHPSGSFITNGLGRYEGVSHDYTIKIIGSYVEDVVLMFGAAGIGAFALFILISGSYIGKRQTSTYRCKTCGCDIVESPIGGFIPGAESNRSEASQGPDSAHDIRWCPECGSPSVNRATGMKSEHS